MTSTGTTTFAWWKLGGSCIQLVQRSENATITLHYDVKFEGTSQKGQGVEQATGRQ
ncbi:hypothetical protein K443DRAFT_680185 [Laccaria amethystina LaAM-08-1]|jgi:hypothetical protein|uniref:Uncharacterized protein n=1 Tax=Laccaria amethystina LaAM-08-1 TaxID=1095629 RepID=A0A0C9XC80_9AGAR|nr:hypothetical protein K443DRAFT_680185 [Laccaria amethystina LaAM-08-1]